MEFSTFYEAVKFATTVQYRATNPGQPIIGGQGPLSRSVNIGRQWTMAFCHFALRVHRITAYRTP
jgi:hypothetical protein